MPYSLEGLIFPADAQWPASLMYFPQGLLAGSSRLVLVPLTRTTKARLGEHRGMETVVGFDSLTAPVVAFAVELSHRGLVSYVHAENAGGPGFQESIVWAGGQVAFGPVFTADDESERNGPHYEIKARLEDGAINRALRFLGVRLESIDEFATVGLGRFSYTEVWRLGPGPRPVGDLLPEGARSGFEYPEEFVRLVGLGLVRLDPWMVLLGDHVRATERGLRLRYPGQRYIPFAVRQDRDDIACWRVPDPGPVVIVHDDTGRAGEARGDHRFDDVTAWFRQAVEDCIERGESEIPADG